MGLNQLKELTHQLRISFRLTPLLSRNATRLKLERLFVPLRRTWGEKNCVVSWLLMGWTGADSLNEADKEAHNQEVSFFSPT